MKKLGRLLLFLTVLPWVAAGEAPREKIEAEAGTMESSLSSAEDAFRDGLQKADMTESRAAVLADMEKINGASMRLARIHRFAGHAGCDAVLLFRWGYANDLNTLLKRSICGERPDFPIQLEANTSDDAATFARNCISVVLQLPYQRYNTPKTPLPKRQFGAYKENQEMLQGDPKFKALISTARQWGLRVRLAEFYFWAVRKNAALLREDPETLGSLPEFLNRQVDDVKKMVCGILYFPRGSAPAVEFLRKMVVIRNVSGTLSTYARRNGKPEIARNFANAYKLETICQHWLANTPFYFYWSEVDLASLGEQAKELLDAQIALDSDSADAPSDKGKKSGGRKERKKKAASPEKGAARTGLSGLDRIAGDGEDGGAPDGGADGGPDGGPGGAPSGGGGKAKDKAVSLEDAIKEYNAQWFKDNGSSRRDARNAEHFKQEMTEFAQVLTALSKGVEEFRAAFPDALKKSAKK